MLDPSRPPGATPTIIPFVINAHPFFERVILDSGDPDSVTINDILKWAGRWFSGYGKDQDLSLRWITDGGAAFTVSKGKLERLARTPAFSCMSWSRVRDAKAWYLDKGHCLVSEPIDTDHALRERLRSARTLTAPSTGAGDSEVRLYVVTPAVSPDFREYKGVIEQERQTYHMDYRRKEYRAPWEPQYDLDEDESILTRMAALYDPAFTYAEEALRGVQGAGIPPEGRDREPGGNADGSVGAAAAVDGASGKDEDMDMLEGRRFTAQLRDALHGLVGVVEARCSGFDSAWREATSARAAALGTVLQELFDDPALKVQVAFKTYGIDIEIVAECLTPCRLPARYVAGKHKLVSARGSDPATGGATPGMRESMVAYRDAVLDYKNYSIYSATCCPCLVIGIAGTTTVQIYAAYLADWTYRTRLCDFALDADTGSDVPNVAAKVRIVRNTARMLRETYARVHVGGSTIPPKHTCRPYLLPRPALLMPVPLSLHLSLLDRVMVGQYSASDLFTGTLKLPAPHSCNRDDNDNKKNDDDEDDDDGGGDNGDRSESAQAQAHARELPVHVKFVDKYGVAAHRLLAAHTDAAGAPRPLAPQLYWAGELVPGLLMIVMETLPPDARMLCQYARPAALNPDSKVKMKMKMKMKMKKPRSDEPSPERPVAWDELGDVRAAVRLLHAHGLVHGDIRTGNVLLRRPTSDSADTCTSSEIQKGDTSTSSAGTNSAAIGNSASHGAATPGVGARAYLIDFDWAGKEGEVRYPALNPDVEWPRPAAEMDGQLITKDDDVFMLERLLQDPDPQEPESGRERRSEHEHAQERSLKVHKRKRDGIDDKRKRKRDDVDERKHKHKRDATLSMGRETKGWDHDHGHSP